MSQVFEGYERQYCEVSANLSRKCTAAAALNGGQKKQKLSEVKAGLDDVEALNRAAIVLKKTTELKVEEEGEPSRVRIKELETKLRAKLKAGGTKAAALIE